MNICKQQRSRPACASAKSGQDLLCLCTQYRDLVDKLGLIAKTCTGHAAVQTSLGLCHSYMP